MEDELTNEDDYRVTYKYKKRNYTLFLSQATAKDVNHGMCDIEDATHFITEITYGFDAYLVFEKTIRNHAKRQTIGGKTLTKSIQKMKS